MKKTLQRVALATLLATGLIASAQAQQIEHGLWEFKHDMKMPGQPNLSEQMAQMRAQMKNMPPEARKMMESQMASMGVGLTDSGAIRTCISPEEARKDPVYDGRQEGDCTYKDVKRSGNTWSGRVICTKPRSEGTFKTTLHDERHFSTDAKVKSEEGSMEMQMEGRWVSADCGAVAPAGQR